MLEDGLGLDFGSYEHADPGNYCGHHYEQHSARNTTTSAVVHAAAPSTTLFPRLPANFCCFCCHRQLNKALDFAGTTVINSHIMQKDISSTTSWQTLSAVRPSLVFEFRKLASVWSCKPCNSTTLATSATSKPEQQLPMRPSSPSAENTG